jgi:hypothetical protein
MALLLVRLHLTVSSFNLGNPQPAITVRRTRKMEARKFDIDRLPPRIAKPLGPAARALCVLLSNYFIRNEGKSYLHWVARRWKSQRLKIHRLDKSFYCLYGAVRNGFEACKIRFKRHWKGWALEIKTFWRPEMASEATPHTALLFRTI